MSSIIAKFLTPNQFFKDAGGASGGEVPKNYQERVRRIDTIVSNPETLHLNEKDRDAILNDLATLQGEVSKKTLHPETPMDSQKIEEQLLNIEKRIGIDKEALSVKNIMEQLKTLQSPEALKQSFELFNGAEFKRYTPAIQRDALRSILQFQLFQNGYELDLSEKNPILSDSAGRPVDSAILKEFQKISGQELMQATTTLMVLESDNEYAALVAKPEELARVLAKKAGISRTENAQIDYDLVAKNTKLTSAEKTWLKSYVKNHASVQINKKDAVEDAAAAGKTQIEARKKVEEQHPEITREDWKNPGQLLGKLMQRGGPMLLIGGGLWLILSCFGMKTKGEGNFFMKLLAVVGGVGVAKATGALDMAVDGVADNAGPVGDKVGKFLSDLWGDTASAVVGLKEAMANWMDFHKVTVTNPANWMKMKALEADYFPILDKKNTWKIGEIGITVEGDTNSTPYYEKLSKLLQETQDRGVNALKKHTTFKNDADAAIEFKRRCDAAGKKSIKDVVRFSVELAHDAEAAKAQTNVQSGQAGVTPPVETKQEPSAVPEFQKKKLECIKNYKAGWFTYNWRSMNENQLENAIRTSKDAEDLKRKAANWVVNAAITDSSIKTAAEKILKELQK